MVLSFPMSMFSTSERVLLNFSDATFVNASSRYMLDTLNKQVLGPFGANVLATSSYNGENYAQVEQSRENLFTYSQDLTTGWTKSYLLTPTAVTDPLGGSTAWKLIPAAQDNVHWIYQRPTPDGSSTYTNSVIAKKGEYEWIKLLMGSDSFPTNVTCYFDLNNGVSGSSTGCNSKNIVDLGNGWYRCSITATSDSAAQTFIAIHVCDGNESDSFLGNGSDSLYVWNPQFEIGTFPSSPIKTEGSSVTRAADDLSWASANIPAEIRSTGPWAYKWAPFYASTDDSTGYFMFKQDDIFDYTRRVANRLQIRANNVEKVQSNILSYSRHQLMTATVHPSAGSVRVQGATSGDGKIINNTWTWTTGSSNDLAISAQANGLVSEPYTP